MTAQSALRRFVDPRKVGCGRKLFVSDEARAITGADLNVTAGYALD